MFQTTKQLVLWDMLQEPSLSKKKCEPWFPLKVHQILGEISMVYAGKCTEVPKKITSLNPTIISLSGEAPIVKFYFEIWMLQPGLSKNRVALDGQITIFLLFIGNFWIYTAFPDTPKYHIGGLIMFNIFHHFQKSYHPHVISMVGVLSSNKQRTWAAPLRPEITVLPWRYLRWSQRPPALVDARLWPHRGLEQDQSHLESNKCGMYYTQCQLISKIYGGFGFNSIWNSTSD